ncbi:MAG: hypothetical protein Q9166_002428 [cf. Caloplaca sp. 2 TL-2023]
MSTQYDSIVSPYKDFRKLPAALLEKHNVERIVRPFIKGAKVLDLACGSGHYSHLFIEWGAEHVIGVDISPAMISEAQSLSPSSPNLQFSVGDCSKPTSFPQGPFDIVFGAWLLNYAPTKTAMTDMFRNISLNLKAGGRFFGVTQAQTEDPRGHLEAVQKSKPLFYDYLSIERTADVEDGISARVTATKPRNFEFINFHLKGSVYEQAAKDGGMKGRLVWRYPSLPDDDSTILGGYEHPEEEWAKFVKVPHFAIVTVEKGG